MNDISINMKREQKHPSIDEFRNLLSEVQVQHLDRLWNFFIENDGRWPKTIEYHMGYGRKQDTLEVLESIGGNVIIEAGRHPYDEYQLSLLGLFLTSQGIKNFKILVSYYSYVRRLLEEREYFEDIPSEELRANTELDEFEIEQLFWLLQAIHQLPTGGHSGKYPNYSFSMPKNIDDLLDSQVKEFIIERAFRHYSEGEPVTSKRAWELKLNKVELTQSEYDDLSYKSNCLDIVIQQRIDRWITITRICCFLIIISAVLTIFSAFLPSLVEFPFNKESSKIARNVIGFISFLTGSGLFAFYMKSKSKLENWIRNLVLSRVKTKCSKVLAIHQSDIDTSSDLSEEG